MSRAPVRLMVTGPSHMPVRHAVVDILDTDIRTVTTTVARTGVPCTVNVPETGFYLAQARFTTGAVVRRTFRSGDPGNCVMLDTSDATTPRTGEPDHTPMDAVLTWWGRTAECWLPVDGVAHVWEGGADAFAAPQNGLPVLQAGPDDGLLALQMDRLGRPAWTTLMPPRAHAVIHPLSYARTVQDWCVELPETRALAALTFLDRGDISSARAVAAQQGIDAVAGTSFLDDLAAAYLQVRTEPSPDSVHLAELRARCPWSSDAALLHGWYAGSITRDRGTAKAELAAALELGPPILRQGLRMLYDGLHMLGLGAAPRTTHLRELLRRGGPGPLTSFEGTADSALWPTRTAPDSSPPRRARLSTPSSEVPYTRSTPLTDWRTDLTQCLIKLHREGFGTSRHRTVEAGAVRLLAWLDPDGGDTSSLTVAVTPAPSRDSLRTSAPTLALAVSAQDHRLATMDRHGRAVFSHVPRQQWLSLTVLPPAPGPHETPVPALASGALSAHGGNDVLQSITGPRQEVELTVSATDRHGRYVVDIAVRTTTSAPRVVPLTYHTSGGRQRNLLVACRYRALTKGATASAFLTDVDPHVGWTLSPIFTASVLSSWSADVIRDSVSAAANKISRDAWTAAAEACGDEAVRRLVTEALTA
ncbi:hypothetical protein [Streptomyces aurantiacus]|uniref:hypothetical protein n=1 Tax=Streptomyces aurantiacus TaxID=47760 RepID=UPI0006E34B71|nr:hypothetical protein [Streptomyces aurantiacus]